MTGHELALACAKALSEKKAQDIVILDVADQTVVCSYFVIASGHSTTQVRALGDAVEEKLEKDGGILRGAGREGPGIRARAFLRGARPGAENAGNPPLPVK